MIDPNKPGPGKLNRADAAEAVKAGAVVEVVLAALQPSLEVAAERTTSRYLDTIEALPPGTGLAIGFGVRISIALIEERGSVWEGLKMGYRWARARFDDWGKR